jgi:hypothetical protein
MGAVTAYPAYLVVIVAEITGFHVCRPSLRWLMSG